MYAQADLSLYWSHIPHCWKSYVAAHIKFINTLKLILKIACVFFIKDVTTMATLLVLVNSFFKLILFLLWYNA